jgi:hypothetical protein
LLFICSETDQSVSDEKKTTGLTLEWSTPWCKSLSGIWNRYWHNRKVYFGALRKIQRMLQSKTKGFAEVTEDEPTNVITTFRIMEKASKKAEKSQKTKIDWISLKRTKTMFFFVFLLYTE